jgi:predicted lactoylglutathione lyase
MTFPPAVPELPVGNIEAAGNAYVQQMGFSVDWVYEGYLAGISRDATRLFLRRRTEHDAAQCHSVTIWLNMASPADVDELYAVWKKSGVTIAEELHTAAYNLWEFTARDVDGNRLRVFYDLGRTGA